MDRILSREALSPPRSRLRSLDVFRGATIASMILVNTSSSRDPAYGQLRHAEWFGWTFADTIFPAFLWIVGVSLTLSAAARMERGQVRSDLLKHALLRAALLFAIGIALSALTFPTSEFPLFRFERYLQLSGVLQKIAVCYLIATAIFIWTTWRGVIGWIVVLNLAYLGLIHFFSVPDCVAGPWSIPCNAAGSIDRALLAGHLWGIEGKQDPDGLGALLPAISSVLFGVLAGYMLRGASPARRLRMMLLSACLLAPAGLLLARWIPLSKPLWTPSYAVLMAGLSSLAMASFIWTADLHSARWIKPLEIFGMNAIAAYVISMAGRHVAKIHIFGKSLYDDVCLAIADPLNASLIYAALHVMGIFIVVWGMYRRRWFLRL